MTTVKELIASLNTRNPEAQVFLMTTRKQPFENCFAGVVGREEMLDQQWREEPGIASDDVFFVVGKRIRPGSLSAWIVAERRGAITSPPADIQAPDDRELMVASLADIAREHLCINSLEDDAGEDSTGFHCLAADHLRRALEAAYRAGGAARGRASDVEAAQPLAAIDALQAGLE
jgi:hypothetical protein